MSTAFSFDQKRCVVVDVETYPSRWCCGFHGPDSTGRRVTYTVDGDRLKLATVLDRLAVVGKTLVSYNGDHFDLPVMRAILAGLDPYTVAKAIIDDSRAPADLGSWPPLVCDHIDLSARLKRGGRFPSLKAVAANIGRPVLRELPYAPGSILDDSQWAEVLTYNEIDLGHTWALLEHFTPELEPLAALSEEQGRDLRSTPTPRVVETVFLAAFARERHAQPIRPQMPSEVIYRPVSGVVRPRTPEAALWFDQIANRPLPVEITTDLVNKRQKAEVIVPKSRLVIGDLVLQVGAGGLHSDDSPAVYYDDEGDQLWLVDVASYYPPLPS